MLEGITLIACKGEGLRKHQWDRLSLLSLVEEFIRKISNLSIKR